MKLVEALKLYHQGGARNAEEFPVFIACSFSPLHLGTYVGARLAEAFPDRRIVVNHGHCGDLIENLQFGIDERQQNLIVLLEWWDFDPRFSIRSLGGWNDTDDMLRNVETACQRFRQNLSRIDTAQIVIIFPTLPLPPLFPVNSELVAKTEACLRHTVTDLMRWSVSERQLRVLHPDALAELTPMTQRWDPQMQLATGFPYKLGHADALATICMRLLTARPRKKGIVIDADDTLWHGIAGDVGAENVSWSLEHNSQIHGLLQQALAVLADRGILIAIASKNDPEVVTRVLERKDLAVPKNAFFPVEAHWRPKSESVRRILQTWNIDSSSVVFIDDSPMEIAEVQTSFPRLECRLFPKADPVAVIELLKWLWDEFGCESPSDEDKLRRHTIEQNLAFDQEGTRIDREQFLETLDASVTINAVDRFSPRAWELVKKTNQFNLNGCRQTVDQWRARGKRESDFVFVIAYQDRFGSLGTIATMAGCMGKERIYLEDWAISCRAFSRRIEYLCLAFLFDQFGKDEIILAFRATDRNLITRKLLASLVGEQSANTDSELILTSDLFRRKCPKLYHRVSYAA